MSKLTKRQKLIAERVENEKLYTLEEAVQILNDLPALKFKESIDIAVNLGVDHVNLIKSFVVLPTYLRVLVKPNALLSLLKALLLKPLKKRVLTSLVLKT